MKTFLTLSVLGILLASCDVKVNVDYVKTTYGFINSGDFEPGQILLWDAKNGRVTDLGTSTCTGRDDKLANAKNIETHYEYGIGVSGKLSALQMSMIESAVRSKTSLIATDVKQVHCKFMITSMSERIAANPSLMSEWFFREAIKNKDLYYLYVSDVAIGDSIELRMDSNIKGNAGFPIQVGAAEVNVQIDRNGLAKVSGDDVTLMFKVRAFRPVFEKNKENGWNPSFVAVTSPDLRKLPAALRKS